MRIPIRHTWCFWTNIFCVRNFCHSFSESLFSHNNFFIRILWKTNFIKELYRICVGGVVVCVVVLAPFEHYVDRGYFRFDESQQIQTYVSVAALMPWQMIILWPQNMNIEHFIFRVEFSCVRKGVFAWFRASIFFSVVELNAVFNDDPWGIQCVIQFSFVVLCSVQSAFGYKSTMTSMQQMNPFSRINNKWICVVSLWSTSLWLMMKFCYILRCIFCGLCSFTQ